MVARCEPRRLEATGQGHWDLMETGAAVGGVGTGTGKHTVLTL